MLGFIPSAGQESIDLNNIGPRPTGGKCYLDQDLFLQKDPKGQVAGGFGVVHVGPDCGRSAGSKRIWAGVFRELPHI